MQKQVEAFLNYKKQFPKIISGEEKTKEQIEREQREFVVDLKKQEAKFNDEVKTKAQSFFEALKFINDKYGTSYKVKLYPRWVPVHGVIIDYYPLTKEARRGISQHKEELEAKYLEIYKNKTLNNEATP